MARTEITPQTSVRTGLTPTFTAAIVDGHAFDNAGERVYIHVKNTDASPVDVTIPTPKTVDGLDVEDMVVSVPATTGEKIIGPFPNDVYAQNDATLGIKKCVYIDYASTTGVTVAVIKLGLPTY